TIKKTVIVYLDVTVFLTCFVKCFCIGFSLTRFFCQNYYFTHLLSPFFFPKKTYFLERIVYFKSSLLNGLNPYSSNKFSLNNIPSFFMPYSINRNTLIYSSYPIQDKDKKKTNTKNKLNKKQKTLK